MSTRKITVYATKGQQMKTIDSASGLWSELRGELSNAGYDMNSLHATENINRTDLVNDNAVLPTGEFTVFLRPMKTKSGADYNNMSFKELRAEIDTQEKKDHLNKIANKTGRNWTQLKTPELAKGLNDYTKKSGSTTTTKASAKVAPAKKASSSSKKATPVTKKASSSVAKKTTPASKAEDVPVIEHIVEMVNSAEDFNSSQKSRLLDLLGEISTEITGQSNARAEEAAKQAEEEERKQKLKAEADALMSGF